MQLQSPLHLPISVMFSFQMFKDDACDGPTLYKVPKCPFLYMNAYAAESKEKHGVWAYAGVDYCITSPYVHSRVDYDTFTMGNPMPESTLTLCRSKLYPAVRDFGFGLCTRAKLGR